MTAIASISLTSGGVTTPAGFVATGLHCGIRPDRKDLALMVADVGSTSAGLFTTYEVCAASVKVCRDHVASGQARAVIVNSGNANACTGPQGMSDALEMVRLTADSLELDPRQVLICSTGVIGQYLPMEKVRDGIPRLKAGLSVEGQADACQAILTTDAFEKTCAVEVQSPAGSYRLGGMAKGAGMIHPNMATTLAFVTTDAKVGADDLKAALKAATDASFNCITVDGDTSTNDTILLLASGASGVELKTNQAKAQFTEALTLLTQDLAKKVVKDGEGARCLVEIKVTGATDNGAARRVAQTIAGSLLFKTMLAGGEPNWGRVLAAAGRAGVPLTEETCELSFGDVVVYSRGSGLPHHQPAAALILKASEIPMHLDLGAGQGQAVIWTCDIGHPYVELNGSYMS